MNDVLKQAKEHAMMEEAIASAELAMTDDIQLCKTCVQMTNHDDGVCKKCVSKDIENWEEKFEEEFPPALSFPDSFLLRFESSTTNRAQIKSFINTLLTTRDAEHKEQMRRVLQQINDDFSDEALKGERNRIIEQIRAERDAIWDARLIEILAIIRLQIVSHPGVTIEAGNELCAQMIENHTTT